MAHINLPRGSMQRIEEDEEAAGSPQYFTRRKLLIPVDDSSESERALAFTVAEVYRCVSRASIV